MDNELFAVAESIREYIKRRDCVIAKSVNKIYRDLLTYVLARRGSSSYMIQYSKATDLDTETEYWISHNCDFTTWEEEVFTPVFGTSVRYWEYPCPEWRSEIYSYLHLWIIVPKDILDDFDMTPEDPPSENDYGEVDPYLIEHGLAKRKKAE
jgi:hypothetical protein